MKIETVDGILHAVAENLEEIQMLLSLNGKGTPVNVIRKQISHYVPLRERKPCPICGKRIKHVNTHIRRNHPLLG